MIKKTCNYARADRRTLKHFVEVKGKELIPQKNLGNSGKLSIAIYYPLEVRFLLTINGM
jgi:hypothetical protein